MSIPGNNNSTPSYEGGQAGALRDRKKIEELKAKNDLKNPEVAFELYEHLVANPYYFETDLGKQFLRELLKTAIHSDSYLLDEKVISGRMNDQEFSKVDQAVNIEAQFAVNTKSGRKKSKHKLDKQVKKSQQSPREKRNKKIRIILFGCLILLIGIFGRSIYEMIDYNIKSYQSAQKIEELISCILLPVDANVSEENRKDDLIASGLYTEENSMESNQDNGEKQILYAYSVLYERNHDMAGWIKIGDTIINYPVMLTKEEEEYYLKRDFDKNSDLCGLPFMDVRCDIENPTSIFLIYGHNMKNGSMFSSLLEYEDYEHYLEYPEIQFDTIYEEGIYDIISVFQTHVAYQTEDCFRYYENIDSKSEEVFNDYVQNIQNLSIYNTETTATYGDQLLVLSTCDRRVDNGRFVVVAKKRK